MQDITPRRRKDPASEAWYLDSELSARQRAQGAHEATPPTDPASPPPKAETSGDPSAQEQALGGQLQSRVSSILAQPMDRKKFLVTAGLAGLGVLGLGQVLRMLQDQGGQPDSQNQASGPAYGSGSYGGKKRS